MTKMTKMTKKRKNFIKSETTTTDTPLSSLNNSQLNCKQEPLQHNQQHLIQNQNQQQQHQQLHHLQDNNKSNNFNHNQSTEKVGEILQRQHSYNGNTKATGLTKEDIIKSETSSDLLVDQPSIKKWKNMTVRTTWTFVMIGGFFAILALGHIWVILLVEIIQTLVYKEVIAIAHVPSKEKKLPWFKTLNWYFLVSTSYFLYGESIIHYFKEVVLVDAFLLPLATHHRFISFALYCTGFVFFVANLKKGHYKFQFTQFAWTHMTLLIVVCQSHFIVNNIFEGLIWFVLPVSLVICNDIFAYICGFFWGKTPLIKLSPKKTREGFVGAWICTLIFGFFWASLLRRWEYMICPVKELGATAFSGTLTCDPNPVFIPQHYDLNPWLAALFRRFPFTDVRSVWIAPLEWHVVFMACFASLIAPFGGFFC